MNRAVRIALFGVFFLSGCVKPVPPSRETTQDAAACRSRADEIYLKQNRALLSERDQRDEPFGATGIPGNTTEGLGDRYGRDQMLADCLNSLGPATATNGAGTSNPTTSPAVVGSH